MNQLSINVQNLSTQQAGYKATSKNLNFKSNFIRNSKYKELVNYAKAQDNFSEFRDVLKNLSQHPLSNLVLNFGHTEVRAECDYGGMLKQGRCPRVEKTFVSIGRKGDNKYSQQIYFNHDVNPVVAAYQTILALSNKETSLYKNLFENPHIKPNEKDNSRSEKKVATPKIKKSNALTTKKTNEVKKSKKEIEKRNLKEENIEIFRRMEDAFERKAIDFEDMMETPWGLFYVVLGAGIPLLLYVAARTMAMTMGLIKHVLKRI